jgi:hypothetical protein
MHLLIASSPRAMEEQRQSTPVGMSDDASGREKDNAAVVGYGRRQASLMPATFSRQDDADRVRWQFSPCVVLRQDDADLVRWQFPCV